LALALGPKSLALALIPQGLGLDLVTCVLGLGSQVLVNITGGNAFTKAQCNGTVYFYILLFHYRTTKR